MHIHQLHLRIRVGQAKRAELKKKKKKKKNEQVTVWQSRSHSKIITSTSYIHEAAPYFTQDTQTNSDDWELSVQMQGFMKYSVRQRNKTFYLHILPCFVHPGCGRIQLTCNMLFWKLWSPYLPQIQSGNASFHR